MLYTENILWIGKPVRLRMIVALSLFGDKTAMSSLTDGSFIGLKDEEAVVVF